jgi:hypothetical protein
MCYGVRMARRLKGSETSEKRVVVPVPLSPEANRAVNEWCERTGGSKQTFMSRLVEFFAASPESMQRVMLRDVPRDVAPEYVRRAGEWFEGQVALYSGGVDSLSGAIESQGVSIGARDADPATGYVKDAGAQPTRPPGSSRRHTR